MSTATLRTHSPTPLSDDGLLAFARVISGASCAPECLPLNLEREFIGLIRKLTHRLNYLAGKPAYVQEAAEKYHQERGDAKVAQVAPPKRDREAPAVALDAVIYSCREKGFAAAMAAKANRERIREMSPQQQKELTAQIQKLVDAGTVRP